MLVETWAHPDAKNRADRFVVTGLQLHMAAVAQLLDIITSP